MSQKFPRKPFCLFATVDEELATTSAFWRSRTPKERLQYLQHVNILEYGEEAMNAPMVRCYGKRRIGEALDPETVVYF